MKRNRFVSKVANVTLVPVRRSPSSGRHRALGDFAVTLATREVAQRSGRGRGQEPRRARRAAVTALPSAWFLVAFITAPTSAPTILSSPAR